MGGAEQPCQNNRATYFFAQVPPESQFWDCNFETVIVIVMGMWHLFLQFYPKAQTWEELRHREIKPFFKTIEASFRLRQKKYILSGETALANFSDLSSPEQDHIAISSKEFAALEQDQKKEDANQKKIVFEIFKEAPHLFAIDGYLNPVEIYLTLKNYPDERGQLSLKQMLKKFQLSVIEKKKT
ncbi:MAG: hypothetical protein HQM16_15730 [Deltaproteobacteria bacterium]|nr:hypothetical protein [Deltaproteobacteria bacterium]